MSPRDYRLKKGWTLDETARKLGLEGESARRTYQRWETGECRAPISVVLAFEEWSRGRVRLRDWQPEQLRAAS
jgi:transcriptional regulator with XRE-family HTH domain